MLFRDSTIYTWVFRLLIHTLLREMLLCSKVLETPQDSWNVGQLNLLVHSVSNLSPRTVGTFKLTLRLPLNEYSYMYMRVNQERKLDEVT